jgi:acetylornithine deacetylase/succinyl-diaminopimelate desuccinylase-like protein
MTSGDIVDARRADSLVGELITGVLGPESNAHGPNEFLHVPTARKAACCVAETLARHAVRPGGAK